MQVLVTQYLALFLADLHLLVLNLLGSPVVILNDLLVSHEVCAPLVSLILILLADQLLRCLTKHTLLLTMIIKLVLVLDTFLGNLTEHGVAFTDAIPLLQILLLLFLYYGLVQLVAILLLIYRLLHLFVRLVALVCLCLSLDDGTPFIEVALWVTWIVPLVVIGELLELLALIFQRLFHALTVQF